MRLICCFRNSNHIFNKLLKDGFAHIDYFLYSFESIFVEHVHVGSHNIIIKQLLFSDMCKLLEQANIYYAIDVLDVKCLGDISTIQLYSCVSVGKKLLGIKSLNTITPFRFHKIIISSNNKNFRLIESFNMR